MRGAEVVANKGQLETDVVAQRNLVNLIEIANPLCLDHLLEGTVNDTQAVAFGVGRVNRNAGITNDVGITLLRLQDALFHGRLADGCRVEVNLDGQPTINMEFMKITLTNFCVEQRRREGTGDGCRGQ